MMKFLATEVPKAKILHLPPIPAEYKPTLNGLYRFLGADYYQLFGAA
jgi:hypothetical protein